MTASAFGQVSVTSSTGPITINDNTTASPFPSTNIVAAGATQGVVEKVTVRLNGVTHGYPDDIDMALSGPNGTVVMLWSDAGGQFDLGNTDVTLDSTAANSLPDEALITSGTYKPANYDGGDGDAILLGALPAAPGGTDLSVFNGLSGAAIEAPTIWKLYVADDNVVDSGSIRSWTLNLFMSPVLFLGSSSVTVNEDTSTTVNLLVNDTDSALSGLTLTATSSDTSIIPNSGLTFGGNTSGTNRTLTITPAANANGGPVTITVTVKDEQNQTIAGVNQKTFTVNVTPVNDAPSLIVTTNNISIAQGGITPPITLHLQDIDSPAANVVLTATSSNPSVIPATNVLFVRANSPGTAGTNRTVQIAANATTGTSTITVIATDNANPAGVSSNTITVTVTNVANIVAANPTPIVLPDSNGGPATPYPSVITIPNSSNLGLVGKAVVSLNAVEHANPAELSVLLVSPSGQSAVLMRDVGGTQNLQPVGIGDTNDVRLTFDVDATTQLSTAALFTGSFLPNDFLPGDNFPAPAPAGPYTINMDAFRGSQINGDWKLYVYDIGNDNLFRSQIAGGWVLQIFSAPTIAGITSTIVGEDTPKTLTFAVADREGAVTNFTAQVVNPADAANLTLTTSLSGSTGSLTITPAANFNTGNPANPIPVRVIAQDNNGSFTATNTFLVFVAPVNDTPTQSVIPKQITRAGQSVGPISFTVNDVETPAANLIVTATSNNPKLLPPGAIILGGSGNTRTITLFPAGAQGGTADITVTVTDLGDTVNPAATSTQTFNLTVNEAPNPLFENTTGIQVLDPSGANPAAASPYPSVINVAGLQGNVAEVQVTLYGITHPQPDDIDVLLVGPGANPVSIVLMSDAGDANALNNVTVRFRQSAPNFLPDSGQITSGDYAPTDYEPGESFPSPAPFPTVATLTAFNGINPNGDWKLYVSDDTAGPRGGVISSWQLSIRTRPVLAAIADQTTPEDTPLRLTLTAGDNQPGVPLTVSATVGTTANTPSQIIQSITSPAGENILTGTRIVNGGSQTFTITPIADASGTNTVTITFTDPDNNTTSRTFNVIVQAVNDAPRFGTVSDRSTASGTPTSFTFTVFDPEGKAVAVVGTSSDQNVVADSGIVVTPASATATSANDPAATRSVIITPVGVASGQVTVTLTATDADGQKSTKTFVLTVTPNVSFLNTAPITINDNAPATPYPSIIDVSGVNGTVSGATVALVGFSHPFPDDVDVLLVAPDGRSVMLMSDAGGATPASNLRLTFADSAANPVPDQSGLSSQLFKPANYTDPAEIGEMPAPAPSAPANGYSTTLASLAGVNPNGQWKLYVRDDTFPDGGVISGGWILLLQTAPSITQIGQQTTLEDTPLPVRFTVSDQDTPVTGLTVTASVQGSGTGFNNPGLIPNANLSLVTNSSSFPNVNYTLTILPATNQPPSGTQTNSVTITATDGTTSASTTFLVIVQAVDDPPEITGALAPSPINSTNRVVTTEDVPITIQWQVKDSDSSLGTSSNIVIQSSNPLLVPNAPANIAITGPDNQAAGTTFTVSATITPAPNVTGTTTLRFIVSDRSQTSTNLVTLEVNAVNDLPVIKLPALDIANPTLIVGVGNTILMPVTVTDAETPASDIVLTVSSPSDAATQSILPNQNLVLGGRGTDRTLTVTPIGTVTQNTAITVTLTANDNTGGVTTKTFTVIVTPPPGQVIANSGTITIPATGTSGQASPYPSVITVGSPTALIGNISKISVSVDGLTHTAPDDIDMLLVGPTGKKVILMSDAGGRNPISNVQLIFDRNGVSLPDENVITTGTYAPTDFEPNSDLFPSPAPAGPYSSNLQDFLGTNPNGTWSLYIVDDAGNDLGQIIRGWSLRIETAPSIALAANPGFSGSFAQFAEDNAQTINFTINDPVTPPGGLALSFNFSTPGLIQSVITNLVSTGPGVNEATISATLVPVTNAFGTNNFTIVVRRSDGAQSSLTVPLNITPQNDLPIFSRLIDRTTTADTPITIPLAVTDVDSPLNRIWVSATSGNTAVISNTNILVGGLTNVLKGLAANASSVAAFPPGTLDTWTNILTIVPNTAAFSPNPVPITLVATEVDANGNVVQSTTVTFNLTVTPVNHAPTIAGAGNNPLPTVIPIEAGKTTTNIVFAVADPDGDNVTVTATSSDQSLVRDADIVIFASDDTTVLTGISAAPGALVNGGNRRVRVTTQPGVTGDATITLRVTDPSGARGVAQFVVRLTPTRELVFSNRQPITIRDNNSADPYPSQINVSGFSGAVSKVTVTLSGFWHTFPDDADLLLVSPSGRKSYLFSDAGGGTPVPSTAAITMKFDDTDGAAVPVPDNNPLTSRTYSVVNYEGTSSDNFASRTPAGPAVDSLTPASLATFVGDSPNGTWSLYIIDDTPSDSGAITNGWSIGITTLPRLLGLSDVTSPEDSPARLAFNIAEESFANPANFTFAVSSSNPALVPSSVNNIAVTGTGTNRVVTVIPVPNANTNNAGGTATITLTEQTTGISGSFKVSFTPVNDAPTITPVSDQTLSAGTFITVPNFNYSDVETAKKDLIVTINSSDRNVIPAANVNIVGTDLRIFAGTQPGTSTITITVTDLGDGINGPLTSSTSFNVTVAAGFNAVASSTTPITILDNSRATPYPSSVVVSNVNGSVQKVTVTLTGLSHPFPDDVDVLLVGPSGTGVVLMSDAGAGGSVQTALTNAWLIFDDAATSNLPDNAPITPFNAYKPTDFEPNPGEFLAPAPAGPYSTTLSGAFAGINPNGTWSLYVQDDASPDAGSLQGWILNIALNEVGPTLAGLVDTSANEDSFVNIPFTVGSATLDAVTFVTSASNSNLVTSIKVGGSGADRSLQITLAPNTSGTSVITVAASDATGTRTRQFILTVNAVNDAPVFAALPNIRITGPTTVTLNVTDSDTPLNQLTFFAATASVGLITNVEFTVTGSTVTARISPAANASGTDTLTISVSDGSSTVTQSFNVQVVPPGPPILDAISDVSTTAGRPIVIPLNVSDSDTAIADLTFFATESDSLLSGAAFDLTSSNTVVLTLTPAAGRTGGTRVTVSVSDGNVTTTQSFNLTVTSPGPVLGPIANQQLQQNGTVTIPLVVSDPDTAVGALTFLASTSDPNIVKDVTFITAGNTANATITLVPNASGSATVTITVSDGSSTSSQTFTVNVQKGCQPPVIGAIPAQTPTLNSFTVTIPVTDADDPLTNLTFVASAAGNIVSGANFVVANGVVTGTFTLVAGAQGTEQVTVTASDGCGSGKQTFDVTVSPTGDGTAAVLTTSRNGTNLVITVAGTAGASYVIERSTNLRTWSVFDTITIPAGGSTQITVPANVGNAFFRVRTGSGALPAQKTALLVVGNATLVAGDLAVSNRLVNLGYTVTTKAAPNNGVTAADANGKNLVVVSSTITSGDVGNRFLTSNVPVVFWEQAIQDDFQLTGNTDGTDRGTTAADQTQLNILATSNPLAAGLTPGLHTVATSPTTFSWGAPQGTNVIKIATIANNTNQVAIYGYEGGALITGTNKTAARRAFLFMQDPGLTPLSADGLALFDAAINWAASSDVTRPGDAIAIVNGQDDGDGTVSTGNPPINPPAAEGVEHAIDNAGQKYLNFLDNNSGFVVTPSLGRTLVNGIRLWTANDSEPRDPASYKLEGSVTGPNGPWTVIAQGALALPAGRNAGGNAALAGNLYQDVYFSNTTAYTSYRVTFPTLKQTSATAANSMQIAEVDLLGISQ